MVEPQQDEGNGRELEEDAQGRVAIFPLVEFVIEKHRGEDSEIHQDQASDSDKSGLVDEAPWRMACTQKDGLYDLSI